MLFSFTRKKQSAEYLQVITVRLAIVWCVPDEAIKQFSERSRDISRMEFVCGLRRVNSKTDDNFVEIETFDGLQCFHFSAYWRELRR